MKTLLLIVGLAGGVAFADIPPGPAPEPQHPQGVERVSGVISGGWEYVYAAYTLGVLGVFAYASSLFVRRPKSKERAS